MHDIHDHEHEHSHEHSHPHEHDHAHEHEPSHEHKHTHAHEHGHSHHSPEETAALLRYMIEHNEHHCEDLHEIYHALDSAGKSEAAWELQSAIRLYGEGNALLAEALKLIDN